MFDIDGTLTKTFAVDSDCFVQALTEISGFANFSTDWGSYQHITDSGILHEIYESRLGRPPTADEIGAVRNRFIQLLDQAVFNSPDAFAATNGASGFIELLLKSGHAVALASGGWRASAQLKLAKAGLHSEKIPAAFSDDALSRGDIMRCANQRACEAYGVPEFEVITYVGDGSWDAYASRLLGYRFVGVATGARAAELKELGAVEVFADFANTNRFLAAVLP